MTEEFLQLTVLEMMEQWACMDNGKNTRRDVIIRMLHGEFPQLDDFLCHENHFQLLIAVMLSARCTDARVNGITKKLFAIAPDASSMEKLSQSQLESIIYSAGFFRQKAQAIIATAKILLRQWGGEVPLSFESLEKLPGVGHKTASVVIGQCTSQETFPVDTHIQRLARRWKISTKKAVDGIEKDLKNFFAKEMWFPMHKRMIAYGRSRCTARGCDGTVCAICKKLQRLNDE
ncbi:MAG: endonuclease III [Puniceicoccales bacterium]|nr:endonuclease III [Puniceicoccales bacterium]